MSTEGQAVTPPSKNQKAASTRAVATKKPKAAASLFTGFFGGKPVSPNKEPPTPKTAAVPPTKGSDTLRLFGTGLKKVAPSLSPSYLLFPFFHSVFLVTEMQRSSKRLDPEQRMTTTKKLTPVSFTLSPNPPSPTLLSVKVAVSTAFAATCHFVLPRAACLTS